MKIKQQNVTVTFDIGSFADDKRYDRLALDFAGIFDDVLKTWARDKSVMASKPVVFVAEIKKDA